MASPIQILRSTAQQRDLSHTKTWEGELGNQDYSL